MKRFLLSLCLIPASAWATPCAEYFERVRTEFELHLGADVGLRVLSDQRLAAPELRALEAHLPGLSTAGNSSRHVHTIAHRHRGAHAVAREGRTVEVSAPWRSDLPPDFTHLAYGVARRAWLKGGVFPVHAACVGDEVTGYVLLVGASGAGKTSAALDAVRGGLKLFSGDKTLVRVRPSGRLEAVAGTRRLTVRREDLARWSGLEKVDAHQEPERESFLLAADRYASSPRVPIVGIYVVQLEEGAPRSASLASRSALHRLSPLFFDKAREDVVLGHGEAVFTGALGPRRARDATARLARALDRTPVVTYRGHGGGLRDLLRRRFPLRPIPRARKKILLGICGIGNGHLNRQLPILEHFLAAGDDVTVFAYGEAFARLRTMHPGLRLREVANPYFVGTPAGVDFGLTASHPSNQRDFLRHNAHVIDETRREIGRPDLVVSDYEMVSAQLAAAQDVPLVTLDQQSKYFAAEFDRALDGLTARDEVERLRLFFPAARARLAASFFRVAGMRAGVEVYPPILRESLVRLKYTALSARPSVYVYVTAQRSFGATSLETRFQEIAHLLPPEFDFHVYWPRDVARPTDLGNVFYHPHGRPGETDDRLARSHAVIATAGHTLLSEALFLGKPVLAIPLPLFEQRANARVIEDHGFGLSRADPDLGDVLTFLSHLEGYRAAIRRNRTVLLRENGRDAIVRRLEDFLIEGRE